MRSKRRTLGAATVGAAVFLTWMLAQPVSAACHEAAFSPRAYDVGEADGTVTLTVILQGGQPGCAGTVEYETRNDTARAGEDYASSSGELRFVAGDDREETIRIEITDDESAEEGETFTVALTGGSGDISGSDTATVTITDDDADAAPSPTETADTEPTVDESPRADTDEEDSNAGALIAIIIAIVAALGVGGALLARRGRATP